MKFAGRELSIYEIINGNGRWYWDRRYQTEAEQEQRQPPVSEDLLAAIDEGLADRVEIIPTCCKKGRGYIKFCRYIYVGKLPIDSCIPASV